MLTIAKNGGVALGAFAPDQLVGFVLGFLGTSNRYGAEAPATVKLKHCSHQLGVLPNWQGRGVGYALKVAQREAVLNQGVRLITWTYDPLLSRNAYLNISKLGAVCNTYRRSEYGDMRDGLNAGLPSDRFQVDWWINTRRVERRLSKHPRRPLKLDDFSKAELHPLYAPHSQAGEWIRPPEHFSPLEGRLLLIEIPSDFNALKDADFPLARDWRFFSREILESAFVIGYIVTDFIFDDGRSFYVLSHGESTLQP